MRIGTYLLLVALFLGGCQTSKLLRQHRNELDQLAQGTLAPEETFDRFAYLMVRVLEDALTQPTPDKSVNFLRKFSQQNQGSLRSIVTRLQAWQQGLRPADKVRFVTQTLRKPYAAELTRLVPQTLELVRENDAQLSQLRKALLLFRIRQWIGG